MTNDTVMNENEIRYKAVLSEIYEKTLKPAGFRKYGGNFRRFTKSAIFTTGQLISFRREIKDESVSFTVLLCKKSSFNDEPDASFNTSDCVIPEKAYLSELSDGPNACRHWVINGNTNASALSQELSGLIKTYAFPWLRLE